MVKEQKKTSLVDDLTEDAEDIISILDSDGDDDDDDDKKRDELIKASEDGDITQKVNKVVDRIHNALIAKRRKEAYEFLTDFFLSTFAAMLGGLDAIESPENLTDELKDNALLKKDIEATISLISPYIPIIGLLGGAATTGKHIYQHKHSKQQT